MIKSGFSSRCNGFHVSFDNGYCLSTQFGYGNYCEGHEDFFQHIEDFDKARECVRDCEVAVLYNDELVVPEELTDFFIDDSVKGWVSVNDWFNLINRVKNLPKREVKTEQQQVKESGRW